MCCSDQLNSPSNSDLGAAACEVRFAPTNGHHQRGAARPISAISDILHREIGPINRLNSEAARSRCLAFRNATAGRVMTSVHECLIDERLEHLAVIRAYRARRLCHVYTDDLFLGIYPEKSAGVTSPHELARGTGNASNSVALRSEERRVG